jgi:adenylyl-sulfate kinase
METGLLANDLDKPLHGQAQDCLTKDARATIMRQRPCVVWFTGLSGAGKSTIANLVDHHLFQSGIHTYLLDGDELRQGLNADLQFTHADRVESIRRVAHVCALMVNAGLVVLAAFISPFRANRRLARELVGRGNFCEVFVDAPLEVAEKRDPKGLYLQARQGNLHDFTGIDSPYEPPENPEVQVCTDSMTVEQATREVLVHLARMGLFAKIED